jgi:hypothetical protein
MTEGAHQTYERLQAKHELQRYNYDPQEMVPLNMFDLPSIPSVKVA